MGAGASEWRKQNQVRAFRIEKMDPSAITWITWRISGNKPKSGVFLAAAHFSLLTAGFLAVTPIGVYFY